MKISIFDDGGKTDVVVSITVPAANISVPDNATDKDAARKESILHNAATAIQSARQTVGVDLVALKSAELAAVNAKYATLDELKPTVSAEPIAEK